MKRKKEQFLIIGIIGGAVFALLSGLMLTLAAPYLQSVYEKFPLFHLVSFIIVAVLFYGVFKLLSNMVDKLDRE